MVNIQMTGAQMVLKAFEDHQVDTIFGYPEISVSESDYDRESTLYVKDSKNGFTETS